MIKNGHTKLNPTPGCVIICTKYEGMAGNGNGKTRDQSGIWDGTVSLTFGSCPYFSELGSGHASVFYCLVYSSPNFNRETHGNPSKVSVIKTGSDTVSA